MAADLEYDSEIVPVFITHRKVRRSRCMCLLFLFLVATFVGLAPIMVYRSLGVPLPDGLRGHRNVQPWTIVSQLNPAPGSPPLDGADVQAPWSAQQQSSGTIAKPKTIVIPKAHIHPHIHAQPSITSSDPPTFTNLHPIP
ncbi:hypothetical protein BDM02DRAFT_3107601 [Thelephora ganbajun]|uniref:Uncharacterized protein n=1 Tax=Thelephora ganbajun TaxID=370292 RepID=A0ACB6ZW29_THEGA|nr:hypothetical protein BDM02DRAFT_3107601 [Thelephora ganbajun]